MANKLKVKQDDAWRDPSALWGNVSGTWQGAKYAYCKINDNWVEIFSKTTATVTIYGGVVETVTLTGNNSQGTYTVTTKVGGVSDPITIPVGSYNVTSNLQWYTQYSKTVTVTAATSVITSYPDSAIFWLGNGDSTNDTLYNKCGGFTTSQEVFGSLKIPYHASSPIQVNQEFVISSSGTTDESWAAYFTFSGTNASTNLYPWYNATIILKTAIATSGYSKIKVGLNTEHSRSDYTGTYSHAFSSSDLVLDSDTYYNCSGYVAGPACFNYGIVELNIDSWLSFCTGMIVQPNRTDTYNFQIWAIWLE